MAPRVSIETPYGRIVVNIFLEHAPLTARNFLEYVDRELYRGASFYRAVTSENDSRSPRVNLIQGGIDPTCKSRRFAPVPHESTSLTGLRHSDGALSAVRWEPGSANSEFFIVVDACPALDCGGMRNPDGAGFAVFGCVSEGMDIVRRIHAIPTGNRPGIEFLRNQALLEPVRIRVARYLGA